MKFTLFFLTFALNVAFCTYAENCFDEVRFDSEWNPRKEECKAKLTETEHVERIKSVTICVLQKNGLMSEDVVLDYPKFKEAISDLAVIHKDEIETLIQDCWDTKGSHRQAIVSFFLCAREKLLELCPDVVEWEESV